MKLQSAALQLAKRGLPVFRLRPGTKAGFIDVGWAQGEATSDLLAVYDKFAEGDFNIGVATAGRVVVDVDCHGGSNGFEAFQRFEWPETFTVRTPSGGLHLYFDAAGRSFGQRDLAPGINIRATGGYVVGPGSAVGGKPYVVECDAAIAALPAWLAERLEIAPQKVAEPPRCAGELDTPDAIEAARAWLCGPAPLAIEGCGGDACTYRVACRILDYGVSPEIALQLMAEHWNLRCSPPWPLDELECKVSNAAQYRQAPIGRDNPTAGFETSVRDEPPAQPVLFKPTAAQWKGCDPEPIPFLTDRLIPLGFVTLLVSAGGRGKSTLAQQLMTCVAAGAPFLGFQTLQGAAAGIFCEDAANTLHVRQKAICANLGISFDAVADRLSPTSFLGADPVLWTEKQGPTQRLAELEAQLAERADTKLLVIDGTAFVFAASEIDRGQVTRFLATITGLAQRCGVAVVLIHHEAKSTEDTDTHAASGSTAWINACRSVLKLSDSGGDLRTLKHIKANLAKRIPALPCTMAGGAFAPLSQDSERRERCRDLAERLMRSAIQNGMNLSDKARAGDAWAPRWLAGCARADGHDFTEAEFDVALGDLAEQFSVVEVIVKGKARRRYICSGATCAGSPPVPFCAGSAGSPPVQATTGGGP